MDMGMRHEEEVTRRNALSFQCASGRVERVDFDLCPLKAISLLILLVSFPPHTHLHPPIFPSPTPISADVSRQIAQISHYRAPTR